MDFRQVSLCDTSYKIISKVIASRFKGLLDPFVSPEKSRFLPRRSIFDGIFLSHELIHSLSNNKFLGMLLKLYINKAFDIINWHFLIKILRKFGFSVHFCNWVFNCIIRPSFSMLINGNVEGLFEGNQGV